jgi:hypothetical protein
MYLHANAKLGFAGRFAVVKAIVEGMSAEGGRARLLPLADDGASLVASMGGPKRGKPAARSRLVSSLEPAAPLAVPARPRA